MKRMMSGWLALVGAGVLVGSVAGAQELAPGATLASLLRVVSNVPFAPEQNSRCSQWTISVKPG